MAAPNLELNDRGEASTINNLTDDMLPPGDPQPSSVQQPRKLTALERNNLKWESLREEIRIIYLEQDKTLDDTMLHFGREHNFKASERKWKVKIKEWGFEKNFTSKEKIFIAAKAERRKIDGKDTLFYRNGVLVGEEKIEHFKKQKLDTKEIDSLLVPPTPSQVTYATPRLEDAYDHMASFEEVIVEDARDSPLTDWIDMPQDVETNGQPPRDKDRAKPASTPENHHIIRVTKTHYASAHPLANSMDFITSSLERYQSTELANNKEQSEPDEEIDVLLKYRYPELYWKKCSVEILQQHRNNPPTMGEDEVSIFRCLRHSYAILVHENLLLSTIELGDLFEGYLQRCRRHLHSEVSLGLYRTKDDPIRLAYHLASAEVQESASELRTQKTLRFLIVIFALELYEGALYDRWFEKNDGRTRRIQQLLTHVQAPSLNAPFDLRLSSARLVSAFKEISGFVTEIHSGFIVRIPRSSYRTHEMIWEAATTFSSACSAVGWEYEAEALFAVLHEQYSDEHYSGVYREYFISTNYCLHLQRQQKWKNIYLEAHRVFQRMAHRPYLAMRPEDFNHFLSIEEILKSIPMENERLISLGLMKEIWDLSNAIHRVNKTISFSLGLAQVNDTREETKGPSHDEASEDSKSTNRFGVTYTDSGMTGISLNYSDLWRTWR